MSCVMCLAAILLVRGGAQQKDAFGTTNFEGRRAFVIGSCPYVSLEDFSFGKQPGYPATHYDLTERYRCVNKSKVGVIALKVRFARFNAFDELIGSGLDSRPGKLDDLAYLPLGPGKSDEGRLDTPVTPANWEDGLVFTDFAYVAAVRLSNGTLWRASMPEVTAAVMKRLPGWKGTIS